MQKQLDDINAELMTLEDYESTSYSKMLRRIGWTYWEDWNILICQHLK
ncbi:MAG: hypothetical protein IPJ13_26200 [Saprospiraceae bacterium]|nr:hypothetical protein [Saprospiraceae bacterium]